jgi:uncharacterized phiE125 gp8 family phage protein
MGLQLVSAPTVPPVSRDLVKQFLHVEHTEKDDLIDALIGAETAFAESFTGLALVAQTWDYFQDAFPAEADELEYIRLPLGNVISVTGVFYLDGDAIEQEWDAENYDVDLASVPARIHLADAASWPTTYDGMNAARVRFVAGQQDTGSSPSSPDVLKDIQLAIMLRVQADFDGGEQAKALRDASEVYLKRRRITVSLG